MFSKKSQWIWLEQVPEVNCYLEFMQEFVWEPEKGAIKLLISADGQYALYLNGIYLPSTQYTDYPQWKSVQTVEFPVENLQEKNILLMQVRHLGVDTSTCRKEIPGLRYELWQGEELLAFSGEKTDVRPMTCYQSGPVPYISGQLGMGFIHSLKEPAAWEKSVAMEKECIFTERPIPELKVGAPKMGQLLSQGVFAADERNEWNLQQYAGLFYRDLKEMSGQTGTLLPAESGIKLISREKDGIYLVVDLKEMSAGYLFADLECPKNTRIQVGFGEHLRDLRVRTDVGGRHFTVEFEAKAGRNTFLHPFIRLGCRYLELFLYTQEATLYYAGILPVAYPMNETPYFKCGDHLHNKIFEISRKSLSNSVHEHYEDCPWREQALYAFDSRSQMLSGYYAFGEFTQARASLKLLALSQREDGLLELCAPARVGVNIPSFSLAFIASVEEYCRYSGDVEFGREMLPTMKRILESVRGHVQDGMVWNYKETQYWNFYEWRPLLDGGRISRDEEIPESAEAGLQLFYILALQALKKILGYLNMDGSQVAEELVQIQTGMEQFWNPKIGAYASFIQNGEKVQYAELIQALALCTHTCPTERREALADKLYNREFVPISLAYSIFKYEALLTQPERFGEKVFDEIAKRWGAMLFEGATSFWETDEGAEDFDRAGSLCHGWSGIPAYFYGAYVLGVRPESPGVWKKYPPVKSGICRAEGMLCTPQGELKIKNL